MPGGSLPDVVSNTRTIVDHVYVAELRVKSALNPNPNWITLLTAAPRQNWLEAASSRSVSPQVMLRGMASCCVPPSLFSLS